MMLLCVLNNGIDGILYLFVFELEGLCIICIVIFSLLMVFLLVGNFVVCCVVWRQCGVKLFVYYFVSNLVFVEIFGLVCVVF